MAPTSRSIVSISATVSSSLRASLPKARALPPSFSIAATRGPSLSACRRVTHATWPSRAKRRAMAPPVASPAPITKAALLLMLDKVRFSSRDLKPEESGDTDGEHRILFRLRKPRVLPRLHADARARAAHWRDHCVPPDAARWRVQGDRQPVADQHSGEGRVADGRPAAFCAALWRALCAQSALPDQHAQPDARRDRGGD